MGFLVEHELGVSWLCFSLVCNYFQCLGSPHRPLRVPLPPRADGRHQAGGAAHPGEDHDGCEDGEDDDGGEDGGDEDGEDDDGSDSFTQSWCSINHEVFNYLPHSTTRSPSLTCWRVKLQMSCKSKDLSHLLSTQPGMLQSSIDPTMYGTKMFDLLQL